MMSASRQVALTSATKAPQDFEFQDIRGTGDRPTRVSLVPIRLKEEEIFQVVGRRCVRLPTLEPIPEPFGTSQTRPAHKLSGLRTTVAGVTCRPSSKRAELTIMTSICQDMMGLSSKFPMTTCSIIATGSSGMGVASLSAAASDPRCSRIRSRTGANAGSARRGGSLNRLWTNLTVPTMVKIEFGLQYCATNARSDSKVWSEIGKTKFGPNHSASFSKRRVCPPGVRQAPPPRLRRSPPGPGTVGKSGSGPLRIARRRSCWSRRSQTR